MIEGMERPPPSRRAPRLARLFAVLSIGLGLSGTAAYYVFPLAGRLFVRSVELFVEGCVWAATSIGAGVSIWSVVGTIIRAALASLATPAGSLALTILVVIGIAALYWLQRLLDAEEESSS